MSWWQLAAFTVGAIVVIATSIVGTLSLMWRRQEQRDGLR